MSDIKVKTIEAELHELYQEIEEGRNMEIARRAVHIASVLLAKVKRQKTMLQIYQQQRQTNAGDLISKHATIDALKEHFSDEPFPMIETGAFWEHKAVIDVIERQPDVQPTLYGYDIRHLELIASVLRKENLPPERITEVLTDIGRIVAIVTDEYEETLRKAVEQCKI